MPRRYFFKTPFQKAFESLPREKQILVTKALEDIRHYLESGQASYGLRIKKLYEGSGGKTFEARVGLDLRIVWVQSKEEVIFSLLGSHNQVKHFLKNL